MRSEVPVAITPEDIIKKELLLLLRASANDVCGDGGRDRVENEEWM